jgi:hypothetical protein
MRHASHEGGAIYGKFMVPLAKALEVYEEEWDMLAWAWVEDIPGWTRTE